MSVEATTARKVGTRASLKACQALVPVGCSERRRATRGQRSFTHSHRLLSLPADSSVMLPCTSFFAQPMCSSSSPSAARAPPSSKIYCTHTHTTHMRTHKSTRARARTRLKTTPRTNCRLFGGALVRMQTIASHTEIMFTEAARNHGRADRCHRLLRWPSMFIWLVETTPQTAGKVEATDDSHAIGRLMLVCHNLPELCAAN